MSAKRTIERLWRDAVAAGRQTPAYLVQDGDGWREISWTEAAERVEGYANGLLSLGVRKGDAFAILGTNRVEWALFDFALGSIGAIGAPIYANSSTKDAGYILDHSESVGVLCEDDVQRAKVEEVRGGIPRLRHVLTYADLDDLAARGRAYAPSSRTRCARPRDAIEEGDLFTYIYTSGTTGPPKGCMISHLNYYAMVAVVDDLPSFTGPEDTMLLYLPLAHNFGRLMHLSGAYVGYAIAFLPDPLQVAAALSSVKPTVFPSVPRVYEKIHTAVVARFDEATGPRRKLVDWALGVGRARQRPAPRRQARPSRPRRSIQARRQARLQEGEGAARRQASHGDLRRRAALTRDRGVLPRDRHPADRGLRADRVHDGRVDEHARGLPLRHRRASAPGDRGQAGRGRGAADPERDDLPGLLQGPGGDRGGARRRWLAADGRHRGDRRRRLHQDHRPQEGHHRHRRRQECRAAEPGERPEDVASTSPRRWSSATGSLHRGADHARPGGTAEVGGRARARR